MAMPEKITEGQVALASWLSAQPMLPQPGRVLLRGLLVGGTLLALSAVVAVSRPDEALLADPELARLIRFMAVVKAAFVVLAAGLAAWRFAWVIATQMAVSYLVGTWMMAAATGLIWQLSAIPLAAVLFHAGGLALLVTAFLDRRGLETRI